jgi:hypothetical protein
VILHLYRIGTHQIQGTELAFTTAVETAARPSGQTVHKTPKRRLGLLAGFTPPCAHAAVGT